MTVASKRAEPYVLSEDEHIDGRTIDGLAFRILSSGEQTADVLTVFDYTAPPGFAGPPLHVHRTEDEAFYVVRGALTVQSGDARTVVEPGGFVWAPRGVAHGFANLGEGPVQFILMVTPAGIEKMLLDVADYYIENEPDIDPQVMADINSTWVDVVGPPVGAQQSS